MAPGRGQEMPGNLTGALRAAGMVTDAAATERLHQYWVHGEGAAKIRWGQPGDFDRCVERLSKFIREPKGYCNLAHHAALGIYPATHAAMEKHAGRAAMADNKPYGDVRYADPKNGKYPIDTAAHCKAAWAYINMPKNAAMYPLNGVTLSEVKGRIAAACKKFGIEISADSGRVEDGPTPFMRSFPLEDISIRAGGDGRTVDAYAAVFETPVPIHDQDGDYIEVIDPAAFNRILPKVAPQGSRSNWRVGVFYNHGMTIHGTASDRNSLPIGVPVEIKADQRGLFTRTRYHKGELADQVLEAIREGSLSGYSFSGRFDRSAPPRPRGGWHPDRAGTLPVVRRTESTLREYGPTPFPAYADAGITAVRADLVTAQLDQVTEALRSGVPLDSLPEYAAAPDDQGSVPGDSPTPVARSARSIREEMTAARTAFLLRYRR